ncbi:MAG: histidine kinase [Actinomycetota bacterium]|nr:histidine kinase [Actinomycetota bacterium]
MRKLLRTVVRIACSAFADLGAAVSGWPRQPAIPDPPSTELTSVGTDPGGVFTACTDKTCVHRVELVRVQRDLHDQVGSSLAGMAMQLEITQRLMQSDAGRAGQLLTEVRDTTTHLVGTVRGLSVQRHRRPPARGGVGGIGGVGPGSAANFAQALENMACRMRQVIRDRLEISIDIAPGVDSVEGEVGWAAFWIVNEALTNVLRHSHARHCVITLWINENELHVQVKDDGIGAVAMPRVGGSGLGNMVDRADEVGGWCTMLPSIPTGVVVLATLPLTAADRG